ncbi:MAG: aspartate ammonia-lyase, partial [Deltaproteobacteria bacterium]|nr:aspartate ammonia-lyase [Deltaproteobacteria bacterium]
MTRTETDSLGDMTLPKDALYGIQSLRAKANFPLDCPRVNMGLIYAIVKVKKAAALTRQKLEENGAHLYEAIASACDQVLAGQANDMFIVPALQGGAGTSTNMNVNEVLANLALLQLGYEPGRYDIVHPLDHVNRGQSTNDVYPTALRIASIELLRGLS